MSERLKTQDMGNTHNRGKKICQNKNEKIPGKAQILFTSFWAT